MDIRIGYNEVMLDSQGQPMEWEWATIPLRVCYDPGRDTFFVYDQSAKEWKERFHARHGG